MGKLHQYHSACAYVTRCHILADAKVDYLLDRLYQTRRLTEGPLPNTSSRQTFNLSLPDAPS